MRITRGKITITDVAGVDYIEVDTQNNVANIKFGFSNYPLSFEYARLVDFRDALTAAIDAMTEANNSAAAKSIDNPPQPAVKRESDFTGTVGNVIPLPIIPSQTNILAVKDKDGDTWVRNSTDVEFQLYHLFKELNSIIATFGPVTVTKVEESAGTEKPQPKPVAEVGDIFNKGDEEPVNILRVRDGEGDIWRKHGEDDYQLDRGSGTPWEWKTLLEEYGPLTVTAVGEQE